VPSARISTSIRQPIHGTASKILLTADNLTLGNDGTDDTELTVQLVSAAGTAVDSTAPITLAVTSGGGLFPTGTSMTFDNSKCPDTRCIRYGMVKMTDAVLHARRNYRNRDLCGTAEYKRNRRLH
jgi:hypothetical protein